MPNVQGTPSTGMFVGNPAPNPIAQALTALASNYAERKKYDLQQQNAARNAALPQLIAAGYQPPGGFNFDIGGMGIGGNATGAPWSIPAGSKANLENRKTEQDIATSKSTEKKNLYETSGAGIQERGMLEAIKARQQWEALGVTPDGATPLPVSLQNIKDALAQIQGQTPSQPTAATPVKKWKTSQLIQAMKAQNVPDTPENRKSAAAYLAAQGITVSDQ